MINDKDHTAAKSVDDTKSVTTQTEIQEIEKTKPEKHVLKVKVNFL